VFEDEHLTPVQRRKAQQLKVFFALSVALALLALVHLIFPFAVTVLFLVLFAIVVMVFFSSTSRLLDRVTASDNGSDGDTESGTNPPP